MKLIIKTKELISALSKLKTVISHRTTLPVLSNVLLEAKQDIGLTLTATDLDNRLSVLAAADVLKDGALTVPLDKLLAIVQRIDSDTVELTGNEKSVLQIHGDSRESKLHGLPAKEFPLPQEVGECISLRIDGERLKEWFELLSPFQSTEAARANVCGIHLVSHKGALVFHATNGRGLLKIETGIACEGVDCISPVEATKAIIAIANGEIALSIGSQILECSNGTFTLKVRLLEMAYPNAEQVIPRKQDLKCSIKVNRAELIGAISYAETFISEKSPSLKFAAANSKLVVSCSLADAGDSRAEIKCEGSVEVGLNPKYIVPALKSIKDETITILGGDQGFTPVTASSNGVTFVVMPMRLQ